MKESPVDHFEGWPERVKEYALTEGPEDPELERLLHEHEEGLNFARLLIRRWRSPEEMIDRVAFLDRIISDENEEIVERVIGGVIHESETSRSSFDVLEQVVARRSIRNDEMPHALREFGIEVQAKVRQRPTRPGPDPYRNTDRDAYYALLVELTHKRSGIAAYSGSETMKQRTVAEIIVQALELNGHHTSIDKVVKAYKKFF